MEEAKLVAEGISIVRHSDPRTKNLARRWPYGTDINKENVPWQPISDVGFHSVVATSSGAIWASGSEGRIGRLTLP